MSDIDSEIQRSFYEMTKDHRLTIKHEDGLYRHLRMSSPGSVRCWSFDVITWPGYLTITGDACDTYTFSRNDDMIREFFGHKDVNLDYWTEKLQVADSTRITHCFDPELFRREVYDLCDEIGVCNEENLILDRDILNLAYSYDDSGHDAFNALYDYSSIPFRDYLTHYLGMGWNSDYVIACLGIKLVCDAYLSREGDE